MLHVVEFNRDSDYLSPHTEVRLPLYKEAPRLTTNTHTTQSKYKTTFNLVETLDPIESPTLPGALFPLPR